MTRIKSKSYQYSFRAKIWKYHGPSGWYFVTVPKILAAKIRKKHVVSEEGWGRLAAVAKIGGSVWKTAIWYDSKASSYLLPIKAQVRKAESAEVGDNLKIVITIEAADRRLVSLLSL